ncbi:MAG: DEAD/DEAH box helicase family protein, partial [Parafilimonas sp.]
EATARIKINRLLSDSGWRFFDDETGRANIVLEPNVKLTKSEIDELGQDFEAASNGFIDFLLLDSGSRPLVVLEAKAEEKNPLDGKEQARKYAKSQNCRFVILSNGNLHYFWDLERGNPYVITTFPKPDSVAGYKQTQPDPTRLIDEPIGKDFIVLTQKPSYLTDVGYKNETERADYITTNKLRFLRPYQIKAIQSLQRAVKDGKDRFLFEMATGTGKTLTAAAIIKLFLKTGNAKRVLFLVDRLELEEQTQKAFKQYLAADYKSVIYKESKDDWRRAEIVVTTVQSLLFNNKYQQKFSPTDFDFVISDEAHRSIGGNARAVFDYFVGYKLGLTATPRDYLKNFNNASPTTKDPRESERRLLLDTYRTFGCENGQPTFRYSLLDGVKEGFLINPIVVDARTDITAQLLSEDGYVVNFTDDQGETQSDNYAQRDFEKRFFSKATNEILCKTFLENAVRDPVNGEIGKSIIFAVSQSHASKLVEIFNIMADKMFPGKYQSDFAVQVTSLIPNAQQFTINFANNKLLGHSKVLESYETSKARVCVTVGMMTTGYDCPDILNLGMFRPIFSPTDFIQIKGRGTRKHDFRDDCKTKDLKEEIEEPNKQAFKLFDFFANCQFFEEDFNYDEVIKLPVRQAQTEKHGMGDGAGGGLSEPAGQYTYSGDDIVSSLKEENIGGEGMKIDRMFFEKFEDVVRENKTVADAVGQGQWDVAIDYLNREVFDKPNEFYTLDKLRKAASMDRRLSLREILEKAFGLIPKFKSKDELLEEEFSKFVADAKPDEAKAMPAIKNFFKAYAISDHLRSIIDNKHFTDLNTNAGFSSSDFKSVPEKYRKLVPDYIKDYVSLNQFAT